MQNPVTLIGPQNGAYHNPVTAIGGSDNIFEVGPKGRYTTLADAITERNLLTPTLLASITATVTGTTAGTVKVQKASRVGGDTLTAIIGREVHAQIGGAGPLIKMYVISASELYSQYYFYDDLTAEDFDLYSINPAVIELLPGYREGITANTVIPSFTTLYSQAPGVSTLYCSGSGTLDLSDAAEVNLSGISTNQAHNFASGLTLKIDNTDMKSAMCDQLNITNCHIIGGPLDTMILDGKTGTVNITGSIIDGVWDVLLFGLPARTFLTNNPLFRSVGIDGITTRAIAMTLSGAGVSDYPGRSYKIESNKIVAENYASSPTACAALEIKPNKAMDICQIQNNVIESHNHAGNLQVVGIQLGGNGNIDVSGNLFNVSNAGATAPAEIAGDITSSWTGHTLNNRNVSDTALNIIDVLSRISTYTNTN